MRIAMFIFRLIVSPFMAVIVLSKLFLTFIHFMYNFLIYGGELISYKKEDIKTISDIYELLKPQHNEQRK